MSSDYRFFLEGKEKAPIIALIQTELQRTGQLTPAGLRRLSEGCGVSYHTFHEWFYGKTRNPHYLTIRFALEEMGCKLVIVRNDGTQIRGAR